MTKILIVEDEKAMGDLISIRFQVEGFEVDHATSFNEAKQKLKTTGPYAAMLTDYLLPDGDLMDFISEIHNDPSTKDMPIIVMTNYIEDLNIEKLKALGVRETLVKYKVVPAQMVAMVKQMLGMQPAGS